MGSLATIESSTLQSTPTTSAAASAETNLSTLQLTVTTSAASAAASLTATESPALQPTPTTSAAASLAMTKSSTPQLTPATSAAASLATTKSSTLQSTPTTSATASLATVKSSTLQSTPATSATATLAATKSSALQSTPTTSATASLTATESPALQPTPATFAAASLAESSDLHSPLTTAVMASLPATESPTALQLAPATHELLPPTALESTQTPTIPQLLSPLAPSIANNALLLSLGENYNSVASHLTLPMADLTTIFPGMMDEDFEMHDAEMVVGFEYSCQMFEEDVEMIDVFDTPVISSFTDFPAASLTWDAQSNFPNNTNTPFFGYFGAAGLLSGLTYDWSPYCFNACWDVDQDVEMVDAWAVDS
jgi:hypothetical protein